MNLIYVQHLEKYLAFENTAEILAVITITALNKAKEPLLPQKKKI